MFGKVTIGTQEIEMLGNAATPYRYQAIFHEDYLKTVTGKADTDPNDFFAKLGFVMAMQASKKDLSKMTAESFYKWLEQFEPGDVYSATGDIADLYNGNAESTVDPK